MMSGIFKNRGFLSYTAIVFLNAFTDLGHKIIIQNAVFKYYTGQTQIILTAVINALILLPFVMLFTPSGYVSDKYPKNNVLKISSASAIVIAVLITVSYCLGCFPLAFMLTFLLAMQSAFYSPAKYGYIKELVGKENIAAANSVVQAVTITAILLGVFVFSWLFEWLLVPDFSSLSDIIGSVSEIGLLLVLITVIETLLTFKLPRKKSTDQGLCFDPKKYLTGRYLKENLKRAKAGETIWRCIIGLSVFWGVNQVVLASFGAYLKETAHITNTVISQGLLAVGGIGIIMGSLFAGRVSRRSIETGLIPIGAAVMALVLFWLPHAGGLWLLGLLFCVHGIAGGLFIVPLNSLIQFHAQDKETGKILAAGNFIQNIVMLIFLAATIGLALLGAGSVPLFQVLFVVAATGALYTVIKLPQSLIRYLVFSLFSQHYKLKVHGLEHIPSTGGVLFLGNHVSWIDWAILQMACPRKLRFVMARRYYEKWYLKRFLDLFGVIPISSGASKAAIETITRLLNQGEAVALFPEGHISRNGQLSVFRKGFERAAQHADTVIVPFYFNGLWGSLYSYGTPRYRNTSQRGMMRRVGVSFGTPMDRHTSAQAVKRRVSELSIQSWQHDTDGLEPLHMEWLKTAKRMKRATSLIDHDGRRISHLQLLGAAMAFSSRIRKTIKADENVGLLLPTSMGGIVMNLALLMRGKTVVNLNYTAAHQSLAHALASAQINTLFTSRRFVEKLNRKGNDLSDLFKNRTVCYMEDLQQNIGRTRILMNYILAILLPTPLLRMLYFKHRPMDATAAILFSSGSEGTPKGVMLSHRNIMANIKQMASVLNSRGDDVMLSILPLFHAFGLTVTSLMPLIEGMPFICCPDPTNGPVIGKLAAKHNATLLCATSTFLRLYVNNRRVHPLMFQSLRMVLAGAEKLQSDIRDAFKAKFGKDVYEGYGATETAPVASVNIQDILIKRGMFVQQGAKQGTVGLPLPGSTFKIVDPDTLEELPAGEDGLILVGGPQVMKGYLKDDEKTAGHLFQKDNIQWYKTGDKGHLDEDGFLTISDRYSRFAKIGGEMISLGAVEQAIVDTLKDETVDIAAVSVSDPKKGEKVVVLVSGPITPTQVQDRLKQNSLHALMMPSDILKTDEIPRLATGKKDFSGAKKVVMELLAKAC